MTEGIIQEVIKKFWTKDLNDEYDLQQAIKELEQELIERIKQELIQSDTFYCKDPMVSEFIHKLYVKMIGDSKE